MLLYLYIAFQKKELLLLSVAVEMREDCEWFTVGLNRTKLRDNSKLRSRRNMHRNTVELDLSQPETNDGYEEEEITLQHPQQQPSQQPSSFLWCCGCICCC